MKKRPLAITVIGWLFIAAGSVGLVYHAAELKAPHRVELELALVCFVRILAIASGVFMLRGFNWARWLLIVWIAYHVVLSAFHSPMEVAVHGLLFCVVAYFLFRQSASAYFRRGSAEPPQRSKT
jgi:hypothetical protein